MEVIRQIRWVVDPRNALLVFVYLLLMGLRPCVQQKMERVLELAPTDLVLGLFVLLGLYLVALPKQSREKLKDLWQGGEARLQARLAITNLREAIERRSSVGEDRAQSLWSASIAACTALMLFQAGSYDEAAKTASSALRTFESHIMELPPP